MRVCIGRWPLRTSCTIAASSVVTLSPHLSSQSVSYRNFAGIIGPPFGNLCMEHALNITFPLSLDMQPDPISAEKQRKAAAMRRNRLRKMKVSHLTLRKKICVTAQTNFLTMWARRSKKCSRSRWLSRWTGRRLIMTSSSRSSSRWRCTSSSNR